jgi:hypothetical protein
VNRSGDLVIEMRAITELANAIEAPAVGSVVGIGDATGVFIGCFHSSETQTPKNGNRRQALGGGAIAKLPSPIPAQQ